MRRRNYRVPIKTEPLVGQLKQWSARRRIHGLYLESPWSAASRPSFLFQRGSAGSYQNVQKVYIQSVRSTPPPQSDEASGETAGARTDGNLLAVRFADNRAPGTTWDIDTEYAQRNSFSATIEGYSNNLIQPAVMLSFVPMGATRVVLEIITPSENGITAERWRKDAAVCPSNWPTDYSLLRAWYLQGSLYQFALSQYKKIGHRRMFAECTLDLETLASRVFFPRPANYLSQVAINQQWANFDFPNKESQET